MNRRSSIIIATGLVVALMAGTVSRAVTLHSTSAAAPVRIVVQTAPATAPAASPATTQPETD